MLRDQNIVGQDQIWFSQEMNLARQRMGEKERERERERECVCIACVRAEVYDRGKESISERECVCVFVDARVFVGVRAGESEEIPPGKKA